MLTVKGIVLKERFYGEADKFIDVLTESEGVLEVQVRGGRKVTSKYLSATQVFAYSTFCLDEKKGRYYLNSAQIIRLFYNLRQDMVSLSLAYYMGDGLKFAVMEGNYGSEPFRLFLNTLHFLEEGSRSQTLLKAIFELRLASDIGMMPDLLCCRHCGVYSADPMYLHCQDGYLICCDCVNSLVGGQSKDLIPLSPTLLHAFRYVALTDFSKLWSFKLSGALEDALGAVTERYYLAHVGKYFATLNFYKEISRQGL